MMRRVVRTTPRRALVVAAVMVVAVTPAGGAIAGHEHDATAVLEWNETAGAAARKACLSPSNDPLHEARMYAITQVAVHDALNAIDRRYQPYAFTARAPRNTSVTAAVAAAAHDALVATLEDLPTELFPTLSGCGKAGLELVNARYTDALAAIPDGMAKRDGIAIGQAAAAAIVGARAADHANDAPLIDTSVRGGPPGEYQLTPGADPTATLFAFAPKWGSVTPFTLRDSTQFASGPPYKLTTRQYANDFNEVKRLGGGRGTPSSRNPEQTEIALFWVESSPLAWNRMARGIATDRRLDDWQAARLLGLLNMAMTDGYIGTFQEKYTYNFWRPETAIHRAAEDGNPRTSPDMNWQPLVPTPPIPDHDSGHSVEGGVAAEVMRRVLGTDRVHVTVCSLSLPAGQTCDDPKPVTRTFGRLSQAAAENGESRVLVGFHFRHAVTDGIAHGRKIGDWAVRNFMQPVHD
jgi:hypothetical protein